jgi:acylphosphatase
VSGAGIVAVTLLIRGRVQGVGYRAWATHTARHLGLSGWVRNLTDGTVEAYACGSEDTISSFIAACQAGPPGARVADVVTVKRDLDPPAPPPGFQQKPTAAP